MKSLYGLAAMAVVFFLLTACSSNDSNKEDNSGSDQAQQTEQDNNQQDSDQDSEDQSKQNADKDDESQGQSNDDTESDEQTSHDNNGTANKDMTQKQVLTSIKDELNTNIQKVMPASLPLKKGQHLSAATSSDSGSYRVIFFASDKPISIDNKALNDKNQATEIARLQVKKYGSEQKANEQIGYENYEKNGGQQVALGHDIKGYQDAGAGSMWTGWNEGRWALATHAQTDHPEKGKKLAKQAVNYLESHSLPVPQQNGMVKLDAAGTSNQIMWQKKDVVYTLDQVDDPMDALDIATSFK